MVADERRDGRGRSGAREPEHEPAAPPGEPRRVRRRLMPGHVCNVAFCPIGLALTAVQPLKPDVVEHLLARGPRVLPGGEGASWMSGRMTCRRTASIARVREIDIG